MSKVYHFQVVSDGQPKGGVTRIEVSSIEARNSNGVMETRYRARVGRYSVGDATADGALLKAISRLLQLRIVIRD